MPTTFKNLIQVLKRFKLATFTNLLGLSLAFLFFMLVCIHVNREYSFDSSIANIERIFQLENMRDDNIWESNFSRPQLERFIASSPQIEEAAITNNLAYTSFRFGVSSTSGPDGLSYMERIERVTPAYAKVFAFEMIAGNTDCLSSPGSVLISESTALKIYGEEDPVGKPLYFTELRGVDSLTMYGLTIEPAYTVGGVYRDFPENTRLKNALYLPIPEDEMMGDWNTGAYYCYLLMRSNEEALAVVEGYAVENKEFLKNFRIDDIRVRPLTELYFGEQVRADAAPTGNKLRTNILLFIAVLIIGIALVNYINLFVALIPVRIKSINTQKVFGCSNAILRKGLVLESLAISVIAFCIAFVVLLSLNGSQWIAGMLGHPLNLAANWHILVWTLMLCAGAGILSGLYPAFYITSFPAAMAINGSYSLSSRAQNTKKLLIGFQFVISIALIIGSLFVYMQNKFLGTVDLGYDKENVLEVRLSMGTGLSQTDLYRELLMEHTDIRDVAFNESRFVSDENRPAIGYGYNGEHYYMGWLGVSSNFPELMDIQIIAGRDFRETDQATDNIRPVCIINETAARHIISRFTPEEIGNISEIVGTSIWDNNCQVQIVGIFKDIHDESLYREVRSLGLWVSAKGHYRRVVPESYSYIKIAGSNPRAAMEHIRKVSDQLNPGYPVDIRPLDKVLDELYSKSYQQGSLVTLLCLLAVILSLVGVFGLVIFESQGREKEIAVRKVFGATIEQVLWLFNSSFLRIVAVGFIISAPLAYYGVSQWLQGFAYKTPLYLWVFLIALAAITFLTSMTVTIQSYRVAISNPASKL